MFQKKKKCRKRHAFYVENFFPENHGVYEVMWKNTVEPDRP
jgi:hypothetical protein